MNRGGTNYLEIRASLLMLANHDILMSKRLFIEGYENLVCFGETDCFPICGCIDRTAGDLKG